MKFRIINNIRGKNEELDGTAVSALQRVIAEVKQRWSVIGWVTKNLLSRTTLCFGRHIKLLVLAAFAVVTTTNPQWTRMLCYGPFFLSVIYKEGLCPSSGEVNRLMMTRKKYLFFIVTSDVKIARKFIKIKIKATQFIT
jgi:hypothetical protein